MELFFLLSVVSPCVLTQTQTMIQLWSPPASHPKSQNTVALVSISPICQFLFGCGQFESIPSTHLSLTLFLYPSNRGWIYCVQTSLSASNCKLCHMQMAVSGAIHPRLLSVVGSGAHYRCLLWALTATTRSSSELKSSCGWLNVGSLQNLLPLWAGKQRLQKKGLCLRGGC